MRTKIRRHRTYKVAFNLDAYCTLVFKRLSMELVYISNAYQYIPNICYTHRLFYSPTGVWKSPRAGLEVAVKN
jgi:hypothetical protein